MKLLRRQTRRRASQLQGTFPQPGTGTRCRGSLQHAYIEPASDDQNIVHSVVLLKNSNTGTHKNCSTKPAAWVLLAALIVAGTCAGFIFSVQTPADQTLNITANSTEYMDPYELTGGHRISSRKEWGGLEVPNMPPLLHPTPLVVISQSDSKLKCIDFSECKQYLQNLQLMDRIGTRRRSYNFVIGGDGQVYEEKGWDTQSFYPRAEGVLGLCFVGNFSKHHLTPAETESALELLSLGVRLNKLAQNYKLVGQNQLKKSLTLGKNIAEVISKWPHWTPELNIT